MKVLVEAEKLLPRDADVAMVWAPEMHAYQGAYYLFVTLTSRSTLAVEKPVAAKGWLQYAGIRVDFDGAVTDLAGQRNLKGAILVKGPSLAVLGRLINSPLPTTGPFRLKGRIEKEGDVWRALVSEARIGKSDLEGRFVYDPRSGRPRLDGELKGKHFVLADLAPAFGTRNQEGVEVKPPPGKVLPNRPLDLPSLTRMDARLAVAFDTVELGKAFSQPISPLKGTLTLDKGRLVLSDMLANTAEGSLSGSFSVDGTQVPPLWQADLAWNGIRLENWLKSAKEKPQKGHASAKGGNAPSTTYFTGTLNGHAKLTGHGRSTAELIGSLDGRSTMFVRHGTLSQLVVEVLGLDVAQGLGLLLSGDQRLPMECAIADMEARHGRVTPRVAVVDTPVTLVLIDGNVDLGSERLDLRLTAKPKNMSPFTVRSPILVRGPFAKPQATPEAGPIAARVLGAVALAFVNPLAAILPFIDPGSTATSPCLKSLAGLAR
ncbi:MAG: AsmA family protein [Zoogloea sp.]|nr:AsmA family protein [Zoogloea sp.]